jgi:transglutaminase-like putative cysteine protease
VKPLRKAKGDGSEEGRVPPPSVPAGRARLLRVAFTVLAAAVLAAGLAFGYSLLVKPSITKLSPLVVEPGGTVTLEGRNFGPQRADSWVEVDGIAPTSSSYLSWTSSRIDLRLPPGSESGLVYVVTRHGRSNASLFLNRARLPIPARGEGPGRSGPYIASLSVEKGQVGSLLVISGLNFGSNRQNGAVYFGWNPEGSNSGPEDRGEGSYVAGAEVDLGYESWSDKEIRVRVPDGAASGGVVVAAGGSRSNAVFFEVSGLPGQKRYKDRRSYSIAYSVNLTKVKASGPNELYLWVPKPVVSASQRISRVLAQEPPPFVPDYRGTSLYLFKDLATAQDVVVNQSFLVQTWAIETEVDPDRIAKVDDPPPLMAAYTAPDDLIPSQAPDVVALAKKIVQGERNPWRASRLVYDWLIKNLKWADSADSNRKVLQALSLRRADSTTYALAACSLLRAAGVAALPVQGYLVDPSRKAIRHAWLEFYVYGLGWVPMDPILGSGVSPGSFAAAFEDRSRYFGNLDDRRIAFSRGYSVLVPMSQGARHASPQRPVALQSFYEESSGALDAYSSFWSEVEVSGLY